MYIAKLFGDNTRKLLELDGTACEKSREIPG